MLNNTLKSIIPIRPFQARELEGALVNLRPQKLCPEGLSWSYTSSKGSRQGRKDPSRYELILGSLDTAKMTTSGGGGGGMRQLGMNRTHCFNT